MYLSAQFNGAGDTVHPRIVVSHQQNCIGWGLWSGRWSDSDLVVGFCNKFANEQMGRKVAEMARQFCSYIRTYPVRLHVATMYFRWYMTLPDGYYSTNMDRPSDGTWAHVALVFRGLNVGTRMYSNGVERDSDTGAGNWNWYTPSGVIKVRSLSQIRGCFSKRTAWFTMEAPHTRTHTNTHTHCVRDLLNLVCEYFKWSVQIICPTKFCNLIVV